MKIILVITLGLMLSFLGAEEDSIDTVRNFSLPDINDREVSLYDYVGEEVVIMDFWASWCAPCMRLMPELDKIHNEHEGVTVIAISIDNPRSINRAKSMIRSQNYSMVALFDTNQEIAQRFQVTSVPHTFVIGYDGEIIYEHTGYSRGDEEELLEKVLEYKAKSDNE